MSNSRRSGCFYSDPRHPQPKKTLGFFLAVVAIPLALRTQGGSSALVLGQEPSKTSPAAEATEGKVTALIRDLEADELATRDAGEKKLLELGPGILKLLPEVTPRTPGELKIRLQRIRQQLQSASVGDFFKESLITLKGKMTVADSIAAIAKQSGNVIELENAEGAASNELEWNADKAPFWQVTADLMNRAKLRINPYSPLEGLALMYDSGEGGQSSSAAAHSQGPFRVETVSTQCSLNFQAQSAGQFDVSLLVTWEPRLKPVFLQIPMSKLEATAAAQPSLPAVSPQAVTEVPINTNSCSTQIDLQLARPPRSVQKIDKLKGEFVVAVPSEKHKYIFEKFAGGARQSQKYGNVTVVLEGARRNGKSYEFRILAEIKNPGGVLESYRGWTLSNRAYLLDAKENRLENVGWQTYDATSESMGVAFLFQINGDPNDYKFVYESPAMIALQTVAFELKDIELP